MSRDSEVPAEPISPAEPTDAVDRAEPAGAVDLSPDPGGLEPTPADGSTALAEIPPSPDSTAAVPDSSAPPPVPQTAAPTTEIARETGETGETARIQPYAIQLGVDYGLDPRSIAATRLRSFITTAVLSAGALILAVPLAFSSPAARWIAPLLWIGLVSLLVARAWWWPAVSHRHVSYRLEPQKLIIRRGVWWQSAAMVPRSRVQHTDVSQGPIERNFGLGTLIVYTAGTQFAAVPLSGLAHETASYIRDLLIEEPDGDDAV